MSSGVPAGRVAPAAYVSPTQPAFVVAERAVAPPSRADSAAAVHRSSADSSGGALTTTAPTRRPPRSTNQTPRSSGASINSAVTERRDPPLLSSVSTPAGSRSGRRDAREYVGEPGDERSAHR